MRFNRTAKEVSGIHLIWGHKPEGNMKFQLWNKDAAISCKLYKMEKNVVTTSTSRIS